MKQSPFKRYSKFQGLNEILYCGMTRSRNVKLGVFREYQNANMEQNHFKKLSKFQNSN